MSFKWKLWFPVLIGYLGHAYAVDWLFKPEFSSNERYDDNITLQTKEASTVDSMITTFSPGVLLGYQLANSDLKTRFKCNELIYHNAPELDFSEKLLNLNYQYQTEYFKAGLDGSYNEQSAINTQLDETGSGNLQSRLIPQTNRSISPNVLFLLSERDSLQLVYSYQDVAFARPSELRGFNYSDYNVQQYTATLFHSHSERLTLNLTGAYSEFASSSSAPQTFITTDDLTGHFKQKSTTYFYQGGMQYAFDELTQLSLAAGMRDSNNNSRQFTTITDSGDSFGNPREISSNASGQVFSISLNRKLEWGHFSLNAAQQLNPSSSGQQLQTTSFSGQARINLSDRWNAGLNVSHLISESTSTFNNSSTTSNRAYTIFSPSIQWRWTPEINLLVSYSHREQEYTDRNQTAIGNSAQLMFSYQPQINRQVK